MTRKNELVRVEYEESMKWVYLPHKICGIESFYIKKNLLLILFTRILPIAPYMELISLLEEDFVGAKKIMTHPLFRTKSSNIYRPS